MTDKTHHTASARITLQDLLREKAILIPNLPDSNGDLQTPVEGLKLEITALNKKLSLLEKEVQTHEKLLSALFKQGVEALKRDRFCCAAGFFETLLMCKPDHIKAQLNLSVAFLHMGDEHKAYKMLENVLQQEPDNEIARRNMKILCAK